ncbi:hypothetical protein IWQ62_004866, partial [Dispira parvispora]
LKKDADRFSSAEIKLSVVNPNKVTPEGVSPNNYVTYAPYFHPKCDLPLAEAVTKCEWTRKDGDRNGELKKLSSDSSVLNKVCDQVRILSVANFWFDDTKYADRATALLKEFFLDNATAMAPNFDYSQIAPGPKASKGRSYGLIQSRCMAYMLTAATLLKQNGTNQEVYDGMKNWVKEFVQWMTTSEIGKGAISADNNHGTSATIQLASYYLFLEQPDQAKKAIESFMSGAFQKQIAKDGSQPKEINRADGIHYSLMNLSLLATLGYLGDLVGFDVWNQKTSAGATIADAVKYLSKYATGAESWPKSTDQPKGFTHMLQIAAEKYGDPDGTYLEAIQKIGQLPWADDNVANLYADFSYGFNGTKKC